MLTPFFFSMSGFVNGITFAVLGLIVLFNNPKKRVNQLFFFFEFFVAFWSISYGVWLLSKDYNNALFWARMLNFAALFIPIFFYHWVLVFLGPKAEKENKKFLIAGYIFTLFIACFSFSSYYVRGVEPELYFPFWPKPGILHPVYLLICWGVLLGHSFYLLLKKYQTSLGVEREQTKYIILGYVLGFTGGATNFLLWYGIPIPPYGNLLVVAWPAFCTYAIIRHRFMDIRLILGRTGVYIFSLSTVLSYAAFVFWLSRRMGVLIPSVMTGINFFILITGIFIFQFMFRFFEKIAGRYFYYTFYSFQQTLQKLNKKLNQTIELDMLTDLINHSLTSGLQLEKAGIVLKQPDTKDFKLRSAIELKEEDISFLLSKSNGFLVEYLQQTKKPIVREEISFLLQEIERSDQVKEEKLEEENNLRSLEQDMAKTGAGLLLPLFIERKLIGIIVLGDKLSKGVYTIQDMELLSDFSIEASIALSNALSYEEISRRKEELEKFYNLTVGRELKMVELKKKIRELEEEIKKT